MNLTPSNSECFDSLQVLSVSSSVLPSSSVSQSSVFPFSSVLPLSSGLVSPILASSSVLVSCDVSSSALDSSNIVLNTPSVLPLPSGCLKNKEDLENKHGVVYLSYIPPYMHAQQIRHLFSKVGEVKRIYLKPEDSSEYNRRCKTGGRKKKKYIEGWVEFERKKDAKIISKMYNNRILGGKKRNNIYRDNILCIKYLSKYKWKNLIEEKTYEKSVFNNKLNSHVEFIRKQNNMYLEAVEKNNTLKKIKEKEIRKKNKHDSQPGQN